MNRPFDRRHFLGIAAMTGWSAQLSGQTSETGEAVSENFAGTDAGGVLQLPGPFLTEASDFVDVSRGNPRPHTLKGEALTKARLTPRSWRLELVSDGTSQIGQPFRLEDGSAIDLEKLKDLGKLHGVAYLKAMQCNNIPFPLGQGVWEGVPLRDLVRLVGRISNVRRVYYWGFHNGDPAQIFQSSLPFNRVMETPPWEPPPIVAYRLNGKDIPLERGGPVRMVVPWAHGFKSIKWLQRIVLTNDYQANDTYALQNNDPESVLKTAAYIAKGPRSFRAHEPIAIVGTAMVGCSGLKRVEFWLRPASSVDGKLGDNDPAWKTAVWKSCDLMPPPDDWHSIFPHGTSTKDVWGFDRESGKPRDWPLLYSTIPWTVRIPGLPRGSYEFRARTVDLNGFAQPEPRPYQKSGMNLVPLRMLTVTE